LAADLVHRDEISDDPDRTDGLVFSYTVAETSRTGATGRPSSGSAEQGAELLELVVEALVERIEAARREQPPTVSKSAGIAGA
jgi:creatinine amidohydrolase